MLKSMLSNKNSNNYHSKPFSRLCRLLFLIAPLILFSLSFLFHHPAFATEPTTTDLESSHITETALLGNLKDDNSACGVFTIANLVIDIFSIGVGILALIGITIVGIKYLTAKGNEEQTRKAKTRMFQIVVGLVVYAILYIGAQWLMPGGKLDSSNRCAIVSNDELAQIKAKEKAEAEEQRKKNEAEAAALRPSRSRSPDPTNNSAEDGTNEQIRNQLAKTALKLAGSESTPNNAYKKAFKESGLIEFENQLCKDKGWCDSSRLKGKSCSSYVATVVRTVIPSEKTTYKKSKNSDWKNGFPTPARNVYRHLKASKHWKEVSRNRAQPGDVEIQLDNDAGEHVAIIVKRKGGNIVSAEASNGQFYPVVNNSDPLYHESRKYYRYFK